MSGVQVPKHLGHLDFPTPSLCIYRRPAEGGEGGEIFPIVFRCTPAPKPINCRFEVPKPAAQFPQRAQGIEKFPRRRPKSKSDNFDFSRAFGLPPAVKFRPFSPFLPRFMGGEGGTQVPHHQGAPGQPGSRLRCDNVDIVARDPLHQLSKAGQLAQRVQSIGPSVQWTSAYIVAPSPFNIPAFSLDPLGNLHLSSINFKATIST